MQEEKTYEKKRGSFFDAFFHLDDCRLIKLPRRKKWSHKWYRVKNSQRNVRARGAKKKQESECSAILKRKGALTSMAHPGAIKGIVRLCSYKQRAKGVRWVTIRRD